MTIEELKAAFNSGSPVICSHHGHDFAFERISALIWRKNADGTTTVEAELSDKSGRSVSTAAPMDIRLRGVKPCSTALI